MSSRERKVAALHALLRWSPSLGSLAFLFPVVLLYWQLGGPSALLSDPNTGVHVRTGEWILAHHVVPRGDLFSFSIQGQAWCDWEWLSDAVYALLHRWNGLAAITTVCLTVLCAMSVAIYRTASLHGRSSVAFAVTCLVMAATTVHWLARPHLFSWFFLALFCCVVEGSRVTGRNAWLLLLPVLMVLWVNLHPGFVAGLGLVAIWFVAAVTDWSKSFVRQNEAERGQARASVLWFGLIGLACLAATLANPYGIELHRHVLWYLFSPSSVTTHVTEWLSPDFHNPRLFWFALLVPFSAAGGFWNAARGRFAWSVVSFGGLYLALVAVRNVPVCAVLCTAPIASFVEQTIGQREFGLTAHTTPGAITHSHAGAIACSALVVLVPCICWVQPPAGNRAQQRRRHRFQPSHQPRQPPIRYFRARYTACI